MRYIQSLIVGLVLLSTAGPAFAFPRINTISSETISTSPLRVKTTFTVELVGYEPFGYGGFEILANNGPLQIFDCTAWGTWSCGTYPPGTTTYVGFNPPDYYPWPWPGVMTFSIVTDQANPCVEFDFWNPLLSKTPHTNYDYIIDGCLVVDAPTPAATNSWGAVKATYR